MTEAFDYPVLVDESETLLRQVHPDQLQANGVPDSSAFMAKQPHNYLLSTRREWVGARQAYEDWVREHRSAGTYGVTVSDIHEVELSAFDDSADPAMPDGHASVDFRGVSDGAARKRARKLRDRSVARKRLYPPEPESEATSEDPVT